MRAVATVNVRARKEHRCCLCDMPITVGAFHDVQVIMSDDGFDRVRSHEFCSEIAEIDPQSGTMRLRDDDLEVARRVMGSTPSAPSEREATTPGVNNPHRCTDGDCILSLPGGARGMGTNGGCDCVAPRMDHVERMRVRAGIRWLAERAARDVAHGGVK